MLVGISAIMLVLTSVSNGVVVKAAEPSNTDQIVLSTEGIKEGDTISQTIIDAEGNEGCLWIFQHSKIWRNLMVGFKEK